MDTEKRPWGAKMRLEFIERKLYWEERLNRSDLMQVFNISAQQASGDLADYQNLAPSNIEYDKNAKHYRATKEFEPKIIRPDSQLYLAQLLSQGSQGLDCDGISMRPDVDQVLSPKRTIEPKRLRILVRAILRRKAVNFLYQSFSRPQPVRRKVAPHALAFDGLRWHTRAYCYIDNCFKDFAISRIFEIDEQCIPSDIDHQKDAAWTDFTILRIEPHPELSDGIREAVQLDYGMQDGCLEFRTRIALTKYVVRHLRLDLHKFGASPAEQQIVLVNWKEFEEIQQRYNLPHS